MAKTSQRPPLVVLPELCKGCGRCIDACPKHGISFGTEINQASGFIPVVIDYDVCNHCGLCISACPEPYGLSNEGYVLEDPKELYGEREKQKRQAKAIPPKKVPLPKCEPLVLKGNYASAVGALVAGCRHVYGYPITPSTEGAELMAKLLPQIHGVFLQAVSEVATVNHMYGCAGAGLPSLTYTSSPGFSLMLEGISYMVGAELPAVFVNVMRPGPGLGYIGPEQSDIKLVCRGLGHGNTHAIVFAPTTPQEMLDFTKDAFELAFKYRNPVIIAADGFMGQMTGKVTLPEYMIEPGLPEWAVYGDADHRDNLISSIFQDYDELEAHNVKINEKYARITANEQRANLYQCDDAEIVVISCNTPARMAKGAVAQMRKQGIKVGLFQPVTLWPFPIDKLASLLGHARKLLVVEASAGQLEDEVRLALARREVDGVEFHHVRRMGGNLPEEAVILDKIKELAG